jgi:hypothetical protein
MARPPLLASLAREGKTLDSKSSLEPSTSPWPHWGAFSVVYGYIRNISDWLVTAYNLVCWLCNYNKNERFPDFDISGVGRCPGTQNVLAITMNLERMREVTVNAAPETSELLDDSRQLAAQSLNELRTLS